jgi:hypothetical protein
MKNIYFGLAVAASFVSAASAQAKRSAAPRKTVVNAPSSAVSRPVVIPSGSVSGRTYSNKTLGFAITFPDTWLIAGDDFAAYMKSKGFDLTPKPPRAANPLDQKKVTAAFDRLKIVATAYRSLPGTDGNAVARIAIEDVRKLNTNRPVKDAVDYVDLMRSEMRLIKMPAGFKYSETQAEKLGAHQFAFIESSDQTSRTRIYVTVRRGYAILFSLNFSADDDLETFRDMLARADLALK